MCNIVEKVENNNRQITRNILRVYRFQYVYAIQHGTSYLPYIFHAVWHNESAYISIFMFGEIDLV